MNRYERGNNKRAVIRKERAKAAAKGHRDGDLFAGERFSLVEDGGPVQTGVVCAVHGRSVGVLCDGVVFECAVDKKRGAMLPVVGDRVGFAAVSGGFCLCFRGERASCLARLRGDASSFSAYRRRPHLLAANVDIVVVVASAADPAFHPGLVDRYLILARLGRIAPLVCITKCDLGEPPKALLAWYSSRLAVPHILSANDSDQGIRCLAKHLSGKTAVFVGNSGVGKSTLINRLTGRNLKTAAVSAQNGQGRHTTTSSDLYYWKEGSGVIDTPGIRELTLGNLPAKQLKEFYPDFLEYAADCRFSDCLHDREEVCGVKQAVERGLVLRERYEGYVLLLRRLI